MYNGQPNSKYNGYILQTNTFYSQCTHTHAFYKSSRIFRKHSLFYTKEINRYLPIMIN